MTARSEEYREGFTAGLAEGRAEVCAHVERAVLKLKAEREHWAPHLHRVEFDDLIRAYEAGVFRSPKVGT